MRLRFGLGLVLSTMVACSGSTSVLGALDGVDAGGNVVDTDDAGEFADAAMVDEDGAISAVDATKPADITPDASHDVDAEDDASIAIVDAGNDASPVDASLPVDASPVADAAPPVDASAPPDAGPATCKVGTNRCANYKMETCQNDGSWQWQMGFQDCCFDARFVIKGADEVLDTKTGKTWRRLVGRASGTLGAETHCAPSGRLPTKEELIEVLIGLPVQMGAPPKAYSVCSPTVDQHAWVNVAPSKAWASNGCVDLIRGEVAADCSNGDAFICIMK